MKYNKTNFIPFLICILVSHTSYSIDPAEVPGIWQQSFDKGLRGNDLINDVLISSLEINATSAKDKKKQQTEHADIINEIQHINNDPDKPALYQLQNLANNIITIKKEMLALANTLDNQWANNTIPTTEWNATIADKAIEVINSAKTNLDQILKITNETIDIKALKKGNPQGGWMTPSRFAKLNNDLIDQAKENIRNAITQKINATAIAQEKEIIEQETGITEPQSEPILTQPETNTTEPEIVPVQPITPKQPIIRVPEIVIPEKPVTTIKEESTTATTTTIPSSQEIPIIEPVTPVEEKKEEEIKEAQELELKKAQSEFAALKSYFNNRITEASIYGYNDKQLEQYQQIVEDLNNEKSFSLEEINTANQLFEELTKAVQSKHETDQEKNKLEKLKLEAEEAENRRKSAEEEQEKKEREKERLLAQEKAAKEKATKELELKKAQSDFANHQSYFKSLIADAPNYGYTKKQLEQYQQIIKDFRNQKSFSLEEINAAKQLFDDLNKTMQSTHEDKQKASKEKKALEKKQQEIVNLEKKETKRKEDQALLKSKVREFTMLLKQAHDYNLATIDREQLIEKIQKDEPLTQEEIDSINNRFESLRELIAQAIKDSMQLNKNRMQKEAEANVKVMQEKIKNLEPQFPQFMSLIAKAEKSQDLNTKELKKYKNIVEKRQIYSEEDISNLNKFFTELEEKVNKEEALAQEEKAIRELPQLIANEIEENIKKGIGSVIVHPDATKLIAYITQLAKDSSQEVVPNTWIEIPYGDNQQFKFKQLPDSTVIYLTSPNEEPTVTIASDNYTYLNDYSFVPAIDNLLTTPTLYAGPKNIRTELENKIETANRNAQNAKEQAEKEKDRLEKEEKQYAQHQAKKQAEEEQKNAQEEDRIIKAMNVTQEQAKAVLSQQKELEKQISYFAGLIREAKDIRMDKQKIQELETMLSDIKGKKLYSFNFDDFKGQADNIINTFDAINKELDAQHNKTKSSKMDYLERIKHEIKENQHKGLGTVIVHPSHAPELKKYIKDLIKEAKLGKISPDKWYSINFPKDTFEFKRLSDKTIEYLKAPHEPNTTIIADSASIHTFDNSIAQQIAQSVRPNKRVYPEEPLNELKKRIGIAKNIATSAPIETATSEEKQSAEYIKNITKEIEDMKQNGVGVVIIHPDAADFTNYIKELAQQANIAIVPNAWITIPFGKEQLIFKQLSDDRGTIMYAHFPRDTDTTTFIANPNWGYMWDYSIIPPIANIIEATTVDPFAKQIDLQDSIKQALYAAPVVPEQQPINPTPNNGLQWPAQPTLPTEQQNWQQPYQPAQQWNQSWQYQPAWDASNTYQQQWYQPWQYQYQPTWNQPWQSQYSPVQTGSIGPRNPLAPINTVSTTNITQPQPTRTPARRTTKGRTITRPSRGRTSSRSSTRRPVR